MRIAFALLFVVVGLGCGRSSPDFSCPAREGLVCDDLEKLRVSEATAFATAANSNDGTGVTDHGACEQSLVQLELDRSCIADRCSEVCTLATCPVNDGGDCATECAALHLADADLDAVIVKAADTPGFCTCKVCDAKSDALCKNIWGCP